MKNKILISFNYGPKVEVVGDKEQDYFIEFIDSRDNKVVYSTTIKNNMWTQCSQKWHIPWVIKVNNEVVHTFNLKGKDVKISLSSKAVGDTLAWAPQVVEFAKHYKCNVIVSTYHNDWFTKNPKYKDIKFISPEEEGKYYATYNIGWFIGENGEWDEGTYHPVKPNTLPLIQAATDILNLPYKEINYGLRFKPKQRPIKSKYICIGPHATSGLKEWPYSYWEELAGMLNKKGYKVVDISFEDRNKKNIINKPKLSWSDTFNYLYHAEYFIGLGSGLSWFNWAMNKPTLMINNFIPYGYEFTNQLTKVEDYSVCNNCWVNKNYQFDRGNWNWCPVNEGTQLQHICQKSITPQKVYNILLQQLEFK